MENAIKRRFFKSIAAAVIPVLLILLFLSRTIYNFNLPVVTAVSPRNGMLNKIELTTGIVKYENVREVYSEVGGTVAEIFVREGDIVSKGQPIIEMSFGSAVNEIEKQIEAIIEDTGRELSGIKISREKLLVDIERVDANISNINRRIEELKREEYKQDSASDYELLECGRDIRKAEEELEKAGILFDAGAISRRELTDAENALESLINKYENLTLLTNESLADKEEGRQRQLRDYGEQLEACERDLKSKRLDLSANSAQEAALQSDMEMRLADCRETLSDYERNAVIYAEEDSFVLSIAANKGRYIGANQQLVSFGLGFGFIVDCEVAPGNNFVTAGDICFLNNASHSLEGTVLKAAPAERSKKITIAIASNEVTAGETFDIRFEKKSGESFTLVPNGAVGRDSDGYFLNQIKRRDGILGKEFYTEKLRVYIGDSDSENTSIVKGIVFFEPVALISDKPFAEGETIKLKNESDFFED